MNAIRNDSTVTVYYCVGVGGRPSIRQLNRMLKQTDEGLDKQGDDAQ
jgi:hypothetical protein